MARKFTSKDFEEHEHTYEGFLKLVKWSSIGLAVCMVALFFIVKP